MKARRHLPLAPTFRPMQCDKGCGECCGVVPITDREAALVRAYVREHNVTGMPQGTRCPYYQRSSCAIYPARPRICQAYGHSAEMVCPRGYNQDVDDELALKRWIFSDGPPTSTLHKLAGVPLEREYDRSLGRLLATRGGFL